MPLTDNHGVFLTEDRRLWKRQPPLRFPEAGEPVLPLEQYVSGDNSRVLYRQIQEFFARRGPNLQSR